MSISRRWFLPYNGGTPFLMALPSVNESERRLMTRSISLASRLVSPGRQNSSSSFEISSGFVAGECSGFPVAG